MNSRSFFLLTSLSLFVFSCAAPKAEIQIQRAANRNMGVSLVEVTQNGRALSEPSVRQYFEKLLKQSIESTYASRPVLLNLSPGPIESSDNLYEIASRRIDDLFVFRVEVPAEFQIPRPMSADEVRSIERGQGPMDLGEVRIRSTVYNGERLRAVARVDWVATLRDRDRFEQDFAQAANKSLVNELRNPNIYPTTDLNHFANLLLEMGREAERSISGQMTCENAGEVLGYFSQASSLYRLAERTDEISLVGSQARIHALQEKQREAKEKAGVLRACEEDADKVFQMDLEFSGIDESSQELIRQAVERAQIAQALRFYANKPAKLEFRLDETGNLSLVVNLRFDRDFYRARVAEIPTVHRNYHVLSLQPFHPLMQRLVLMRVLLPQDSPRPLGVAFNRMNITLNLQTLLNGFVSFRVDGRYHTDQRQVDLFDPNSVFFDFPGFEGRTLVTRSDEIFQERGWLALSSCRTIDGRLTEDGLLAQFFGIPCQL
ncbi:MAG: hypothetical protein EA369_09320 [Bradymonadales bacterium]|nr:MAG: hypothetical protein EA369_09320 [Bradymonadales bacterium]